MKLRWLLLSAVLCGSACIAWCDDNKPGLTAGSSTGIAAVAANMPTHPIKESGVPNFGKLNDHIWRSGQPSREGYQLLASQGLKTVVNLRSEFPQDKDLIPEGVKYVFIPIRDEHAPTPEQGAEFIKVASDPANWPLLVHCHAGEGRAGTMAAIARVSLDKWQHSDVMTEVSNFHAKHLGFIKVQMAGCQQQFIKQWEDGIAAAQVAQAASPAAAPTASVAVKDTTQATGAAGNGAASPH